MAITALGGVASSDSGTVSSLVLSAYTQSASCHTVVVAVLGSTSSSVTSITDTKGNTYTQKSAVNGTGVRTEVWACVNAGAQSNDVITINISPSTSIAACAEEYSGVGSFGNTGTASDSTIFPEQRVTTQEGSNYAVVGIGFGCQSGDTLTAFEGTSRQSSIPAATAVGAALFDNTMKGIGGLPGSARVSTARNWATAGLELRVAGGVSVGYQDYTGSLPVMGDPLVKDVRVLTMRMPQLTVNPAQGSGPSVHGWAY